MLTQEDSSEKGCLKAASLAESQRHICGDCLQDLYLVSKSVDQDQEKKEINAVTQCDISQSAELVQSELFLLLLFTTETVRHKRGSFSTGKVKGQSTEL